MAECTGHNAIKTTASVYIFDSTRFEPFEIGAALISIIAFPGPDEIDDRRSACNASCAWAVQEYCKGNPEIAARWRARYPDYAAVDIKIVRGWRRKIQRRLDQRMTAGRIGLGYFDEALRNMFASLKERFPDLKTQIGDIEIRPTPLPEGVDRHSLNALIAHYYPHNSNSENGNIESRIWRPSLPVIHLAVALHILSRSLKPDARESPWRFNDQSFHLALVRLALAHEDALRSEWARRQESTIGSATFAINPDTLIRCRFDGWPIDF